MSYLAMIGTLEWVLIGAAVLLLFGARKLPDLARAMGSSVNEFKKGMAAGGKDDDQAPDGAPPTDTGAAPHSKDH